MENRYLEGLKMNPDYAPLLELRGIYVEVMRNNMVRNKGKLDDEGRIIENLFKRIDEKIRRRLSFLERLAKNTNLVSEAA